MSKEQMKVTFRDQIKQVLEREHRAMTAAEVAKVLGMSVHRVSGPLSKLLAYGEVDIVQEYEVIRKPRTYKAKGH